MSASLPIAPAYPCPPSILSIGEAADRFRVGLPDVVASARRLGIGPAMLINGVPYYDEADVQRLADRLRAVRARIADRGR